MQVPSGVSIVGAEHLHVRPLAERRLAGDLDEVRRMRRRLAGAALRVGARDVEIAQRHVAEIVRARRVGEHDLGHQLGRAVGRHGRQRGILAHGNFLRHAVDCRRRGEDEVLDSHLDRDLHEGARLDGVVMIVAQRIDDRLRHDDRAGEVDDRLHAVLAHDAADELLVPDIADDQRRIGRHRPAEAGRQIVEDDDALPAVEELENHMAADITGSAGDEDGHRCFEPSGYCDRWDAPYHRKGLTMH